MLKDEWPTSNRNNLCKLGKTIARVKEKNERKHIEKSTALDIDYLEVTKTPDNIGRYDFRHLENIKEFIDEKKNAS